MQERVETFAKKNTYTPTFLATVRVLDVFLCMEMKWEKVEINYEQELKHLVKEHTHANFSCRSSCSGYNTFCEDEMEKQKII